MRLYGLEVGKTNEENEKRMFLIANSIKIFINIIMFIFFYKFINYIGIPLYSDGKFELINIFNLEYTSGILSISLFIFIISTIIKCLNYIADKYMLIKYVIVILLKMYNLYLFYTLFNNQSYWNLNLTSQISNIMNFEVINYFNTSLLINAIWYLISISTLIEISLIIYKLLNKNKASL